MKLKFALWGVVIGIVAWGMVWALTGMGYLKVLLGAVIVSFLWGMGLDWAFYHSDKEPLIVKERERRKR